MRVERMKMLTTRGVRVVEVLAGSDAARAIGQHWNAVKHFLNTGETEALEAFMGMRIGLFRFATDPDQIERWGRRDELDFEDIYES
jgi:hypothetical protein